MNAAGILGENFRDNFMQGNAMSALVIAVFDELNRSIDGTQRVILRTRRNF